MMPLVSANEINLFYSEVGTGPAVVFAHGGEGMHLHWWRQMAAFSDRFRCIAYDARGFGLSAGSWGDPEATAAADLIALMDALQIDRAFLVGQSMGGMAVSGLALQAPARVLGLVMSDTPFGFHTLALSRWAEEMLERIPSGFNVLHHLFSPAFPKRDPAGHYLHGAICHLNSIRPLPATTNDYRDGYVRMRDRPPGDYSNFRVPTLFVVGSEDALTPPWLIRATSEAVAGSSFKIVPDAGHSAFVEQPELYNSLLEGFFTQTIGDA